MTFEGFVAAHLPALLRYATVLACDPHLAEDLTQEVLLRTQRKWPRIGGLDKPEFYVRRMITNEYLSWRRRRAATDLPLSPGGLAGMSPPLADPALEYDERDAMLARIAALPRRQRTALVLRYYCDLPDAEIADAMSCSTGTVRSHVSRALAALRVDHPGPAVASLQEMR